MTVISGKLKRELDYSIRYILIGIFCNALVFILHLGLSFGVGLPPLYAFAIACIIVLPISFIFSRLLIFRSTTAVLPALVMFILGYFGSAFLQMAILCLGTMVIGLPHQYIVPVGQVLAVVFFYSLQRFFIFGSRDAASTEPSQSQALS